MPDTELSSLAPPSRFNFAWIGGVFFRPRRTFAQISAQHGSAWLAALAILTLSALLQVLAAGSVKHSQQSQGSPASLPPDFQYYTEEQKAQYTQMAEATSGPMFVYIFPSVGAVIGLWAGWAVVSFILYLVMTLLGGQGDPISAFNLTAWASLPFALRDLVRAGYLLTTGQPIAAAGLSGFIAGGDSSWLQYLAALLSLVDLYFLWSMALLVIGMRARTGMGLARAAGGVVLTMLGVILLQALLSFLAARLGGLTITQPFF